MPEAHPEGPTRRQWRRALMIGVAVIAVVLIAGTITKLVQSSDAAEWTQSQLVPTVSVLKPTPADPAKFVLSGRVQAWAEAPVYARTAGYLKRWYVDIGAQVKAGDLLAEIETPDVDQELSASTAALATAEAQRSLAETTAKRWAELRARGTVSSQDADEKDGDLRAKTAARDQAAADVKRLQALADFKRVVAPFDGIVTTRATDVGALIGSGATAPLFTVSDATKVRIYVSVPQNYVGDIQPDLLAKFTVPEYSGKSFDAKLIGSAGAVDRQSGAMLIQLSADNADGALKPGGYALVNFTLPSAGKGLTLQASALLFRQDGMAVATVDAQNKVHLKPVTIVQDLGAKVIVTGDLALSDQVIDSPSAAIADGDQVKVAQAAGAPPAS